MIVGEEFKLCIKTMGLKDDDFVAIDDGGLSLVVLNNELQEVGRYEVGGIPDHDGQQPVSGLPAGTKSEETQ